MYTLDTARFNDALAFLDSVDAPNHRIYTHEEAVQLALNTQVIKDYDRDLVTLSNADLFAYLDTLTDSERQLILDELEALPGPGPGRVQLVAHVTYDLIDLNSGAGLNRQSFSRDLIIGRTVAWSLEPANEVDASTTRSDDKVTALEAAAVFLRAALDTVPVTCDGDCDFNGCVDVVPVPVTWRDLLGLV